MTDMTNPTSTDGPIVGPSKPRKPGVAANLSLALSGLGQIYCGCLRRGLWHLCVVATVVGASIFGLTLPMGSPVVVCLVCGGVLLMFTLYSALDARMLALRTREDYRLKEYNALSTYVGIAFLFMMLVCGLAVTVRENFLEIFRIPGESMSPTIPKNTRVLVRKDVYAGRDPVLNELVTFLNPADRRETWIKRVVGLPGDTVEIRGGIVYLNREPLEEAPTVLPDHSDWGEITVPEHHCFVLGDHRARSRDSRHEGPVPMIALVGQVVYPGAGVERE
ncbi:MAG: signal peptidase I [Verrucomicrobiota bacterium]